MRVIIAHIVATLMVIGIILFPTQLASACRTDNHVKKKTAVVTQKQKLQQKKQQKKRLLEKRWKNKKMKTKASWYGPGFHKRLTANGERYNMYALTAAHKELPFGSVVKVTNLDNNKSVIVRINDRGPVPKDRDIDLSKAANDRLDCNLCSVEITVKSVGDNVYKHPLNKETQL